MADAAPSAAATPSAAPATTTTPAATKDTAPSTPSSTDNAQATGTPSAGKATKPKAAGTAKPDGATEDAPLTAEEEEFLEVMQKGEKRRLSKTEAIRRLQKEWAGEENFRAAKELTKKNQAALSMLKEKPAEALKELGVDVEAFARSILQRNIETELEKTLPPEQQQALAEKRELEQLRLEKQQRAESEARAAQEAQEKKAFEIMEKSMLEAAKKHGLEGTPDTLYRIAEIADEFLELGVEFTEEHLIAELREREDRAFSALEKKVIGGLKGEALAKRLGKSVVEEILNWSVERIRGKPAAATPPKQPPPAKQPATQYFTETELRRKEGW